MGFLQKIFSSGAKSLSDPIEAIGNVLDKVTTTKEEKMNAQRMLEALRAKPGELQVELNKLESQHRSRFVSGWRPFIGWICGLALGYNFIFRELIIWGMLWYDKALISNLPPALQMEHLMTILMGMLGLGAYRSFEKNKGLTK